jgi:hypothetical protein
MATRIEANRKDVDRRNNIFRLPAPAGNNASASSRSIHQPAFLRSTKLAQPKTTSQVTTNKITTLLEELGVSASRLIMPTRENLERYEALLNACGMLVDIKRMVDRAEQEVRVLKMQKESGIVGTPVMGTMAPPPVPAHADGHAGLVRTTSGLADVNKVRSSSTRIFDSTDVALVATETKVCIDCVICGFRSGVEAPEIAPWIRLICTNSVRATATGMCSALKDDHGHVEWVFRVLAIQRIDRRFNIRRLCGTVYATYTRLFATLTSTSVVPFRRWRDCSFDTPCRTVHLLPSFYFALRYTYHRLFARIKLEPDGDTVGPHSTAPSLASSRAGPAEYASDIGVCLPPARKYSRPRAEGDYR